MDISATPTEDERLAILAGLADFNASNGYPADHRLVSIVLRDAEGSIIGGLWGKTVYDWLYVEYLVVPEAQRGTGLGGELMRRAEAQAIARGCVGSWLTTFSFQARPFYEGLGYEVFAELPNSPGDNVRIFMRKFF